MVSISMYEGVVYSRTPNDGYIEYVFNDLGLKVRLFDRDDRLVASVSLPFNGEKVHMELTDESRTVSTVYP